MINPLTNEAQPKKGRPSKSSAIYHDGIIVMTTEERAEAYGYLSAIEKSMKKAEEAVRSAAENYWRLGKLLNYKAENTPGHYKLSNTAMASWFGCSEKTIRNSRDIAKNFSSLDEIKGQPIRSLLKQLAEKEEGNKELPAGVQVKYALPANSTSAWDDECFGLPTLSGVSLTRYRLRAADGKFYLLCKDFASAIPVAQLSLEQPKTAGEQHAYNEMLAETQKAFERYYAAIEAEEAEE